MTIQELMHHTRRNRDIIHRALGSAEDVRSIDGGNVNVHFEIERYARQLEALIAAEAALAKAL